MLITLFYRNYTPSKSPSIEFVAHQFPEKNTPTTSSKKKEISLCPFDPNTFVDFTELGIPHFLSQRIINYRSKGGVFKLKTDLKKIYGFPDSLYQKLEPFILLPKDKIISNTSLRKESFYSKEEKITRTQPLRIIDLNTADSSALTQLKGIGPTFASRIIKYRTALGGFYSITQLKEVYGIQNQNLELIVSQLKIEATSLQLIDLNTTTFKEMVHHPYLEYDDVKKIFNHKKSTGGFNKLEDLTRFNILPDSVYNKLKPYLKL